MKNYTFWKLQNNEWLLALRFEPSRFFLKGKMKNLEIAGKTRGTILCL